MTVYWIFWVVILGVWISRTLHLLHTLKKTPNLSPAASPQSQDFISVLIPAKNEEANIQACVESLRNQTYKNFEILVINDNSSDRTESILKSMGQKYINCPLPPEGWTGKTHALHYGVSHAKGHWFLFTDADTRHKPDSLRASLAHAQANQLEFLSLLPHCLTGSLIENIVQPIAMAFLGLWFPLEKVNDPSSPLHFANGQFLMMTRSLYEKVGGHKAVANEFLEDFGLMNLSKKAGAKAETAFGSQIYGTRMYDSFDTIWRGWRRIYQHAFQSNTAALLLRAAATFCFSVLPFIIYGLSLTAGSPALFFFSTAVMIYLLAIAWQANTAVRAPNIYALFHPVAGFIVTLILLDAAGMAFGKKKTFWR